MKINVEQLRMELSRELLSPEVKLICRQSKSLDTYIDFGEGYMIYIKYDMIDELNGWPIWVRIHGMKYQGDISQNDDGSINLDNFKCLDCWLDTTFNPDCIFGDFLTYSKLPELNPSDFPEWYINILTMSGIILHIIYKMMLNGFNEDDELDDFDYDSSNEIDDKLYELLKDNGINELGIYSTFAGLANAVYVPTISMPNIKNGTMYKKSLTKFGSDMAGEILDCINNAIANIDRVSCIETLYADIRFFMSNAPINSDTQVICISHIKNNIYVREGYYEVFITNDTMESADPPKSAKVKVYTDKNEMIDDILVMVSNYIAKYRKTGDTFCMSVQSDQRLHLIK